MPTTTVSWRRATLAYLVLFGALLVFNMIAITLKDLGHENAHGFVPTFNFDAEENVPTLFSVFLLLQISIICLLIFRAEKSDRYFWLSLSVIFAFLAVDEYFSLHEKLMGSVRRALSTGGFFYHAWIIPYGLAVLGLGIILLRWLLRLPRRTRLGFVLSAVLFLSGAILMEGVAGIYLETGNKDDLAFSVMATVEESLEMLGLITFAYFASGYAFSKWETVRIEFVQ